MLFLQASEIQVGENVAQQDEPVEGIFAQHTGGFARPAHLGAEVQIRQNQRVVSVRTHAFIVPKNCYEVMNQETTDDHR